MRRRLPEVSSADIPEDCAGADIGPKSIELFKGTLAGAKDDILEWTYGVFEKPRFADGRRRSPGPSPTRRRRARYRSSAEATAWRRST